MVARAREVGGRLARRVPLSLFVDPTPSGGSRIRRRELIGAAVRGTLATAIGLPLLSCTALQRPTSGGGTAQSAEKSASVLPTYVAATAGPTPDHRGADSRVVDAFEHYPNPPFKSWTQGPPGSGG